MHAALSLFFSTKEALIFIVYCLATVKLSMQMIYSVYRALFLFINAFCLAFYLSLIHNWHKCVFCRWSSTKILSIVYAIVLSLFVCFPFARTHTHKIPFCKMNIVIFNKIANVNICSWRAKKKKICIWSGSFRFFSFFFCWWCSRGWCSCWMLRHKMWI